MSQSRVIIKIDKFFSKEVFSGERFRTKGLFYTSYKMTISVQNHMFKVNYFL